MSYNCQLCSTTESQPITSIDAKSKEQLELALCKKCGLVQQKNIPTDDQLKIYYSHNYRQDYKKTYSPKIRYVRRAGIAAKSRISFLKENIGSNNKKLLDIGAGGGEFVYLASVNGFNSTGIEPNEGYSEYAKNEYSAEIKTMMLDDIESASADIVTLFHVFEHMANPKSAMSKIHNILNDDGYLFVEVPNILQKDASPHNIYFKAHLFYYSKYTLISAASRYFDPISVTDDGNLRILFKKKHKPLDAEILPNKNDVAHTQKRLQQKGWFEYLFSGRGILKPLKRIRQIYIENKLDETQKPRCLLDEL
jgi:2-polyprenyl-3-methyl-5-hydroxy-6-metoxy-1,4-benzoquinol methylase